MKGITRIDCDFFRGKNFTIEKSSFTAFNPSMRPGSLVVAESSTNKGSISSQVACKLALENFIDGILSCYNEDGVPVFDNKQEKGNGEVSLAVLESAFKESNRYVYNFAHKLAAGGRMAALLTGLVVHQGVVSVGRVGKGNAYIYRNDALYPFFERNNDSLSSSALIGSASIVPVELASLNIKSGDMVLFFPNEINEKQEEELLECASKAKSDLTGHARRIALSLFDDPDDVSFMMVARFGPEAIYLDKNQIA